MPYKAHNISLYVNSTCLHKRLFYDESDEKITAHLSFIETCKVRKWEKDQGKGNRRVRGQYLLYGGRCQ